MPTAEDFDRVRAIATSRQELDFFFEQLASPDWISVFRKADVFNTPPAPEKVGDGISFPWWPASRYLARVAKAAPDEVVEILWKLPKTENASIWRDVVQALVEMPAPYSVRFLGRIKEWIHSPYRLGVEDGAVKLARNLIDAGMADQAMGLIRSVVSLTPPDKWPIDRPWIPLDGYDFGKDVQPLAVGAAALTPEIVAVLADEFDRGLAAGAEGTGDYSAIWRPAIEDHEQNWNHDQRLNTFVVAIRDAAIARIAEDPDDVARLTNDLLRRKANILKRIGIHVLVECGDLDLELVASALTNPEFFGNTEFHHEFYRLARKRFRELGSEDRKRYLELVDEVGSAKTSADDPEEAERRKKWWAWKRLGAVAPDLTGPWKARYDAVDAEFGPDEHPDLLSYHRSWSGPTSPLSKGEIDDLRLDDLVTYLETWTPDTSFGPAPSRDGLARELGAAATADPARYVSIAPRLMNLVPTYASWFLLGLRDALKADKVFDLSPAVELCRLVMERGAVEVGPETGNGDYETWRSVRLEVARFLEEALEDHPGQLIADPGTPVWNTITALLADKDPTPASEERFGPPNMDALTYSLNSTRGQAMHAALAYCKWARRLAGDRETWRLSTDFPEGARLIESKFSPEGDPSVVIAAAIGWSLSPLVSLDPEWVGARIGALLGELETKRERSAWEAFLMHARPRKQNYQVLKPFFDGFAARLADSDEPAETGGTTMVDPVERFLDHVVVLALHGDLAEEDGPLAVVLRARRAWLLKAIVEQAGRIAGNSGELDEELDEAFRKLWGQITSSIEGSEDPSLRDALGEFSWWFASSLRTAWTLPELVRLLDQHVRVDPEFLVVPRLVKAAEDDLELSIRALEKMLPTSDDEWTFRVHEKDISEVLRLGLESGDSMLATRARALIDRFGRLGLLGLGSLLMPPEPTAEPEPADP